MKKNDKNKNKEIEKIEPEIKEVEKIEPEIKEVKKSVVLEVEEKKDTELEVKELKNYTTGVLKDCMSLYIRKETSKNSEPVGVILKTDKIIIDVKKSTKQFYKVQVGELSGFSMKKFIEIE